MIGDVSIVVNAALRVVVVSVGCVVEEGMDLKALRCFQRRWSLELCSCVTFPPISNSLSSPPILLSASHGCRIHQKPTTLQSRRLRRKYTRHANLLRYKI